MVHRLRLFRRCSCRTLTFVHLLLGFIASLIFLGRFVPFFSFLWGKLLPGLGYEFGNFRCLWCVQSIGGGKIVSEFLLDRHLDLSQVALPDGMPGTISLTFTFFPSSKSSALMVLCFWAEKMINADLKRFGASGAFLYFVAFLAAPSFLCFTIFRNLSISAAISIKKHD